MRESFDMFTNMMDALKYEVVSTLSKLQVAPETAVLPSHQAPELHFSHTEFNGLPVEQEPDMQQQGGGAEVALEEEPGEPHQPYVRGERKIGRNEPCPCGSGKKYKQCHGKLT